ncbi:MAG: nucleotide pyrophosphohydrolase [Thermaerobacter sp.]|nr:nucleotide pyrophosphohydrolase [Thermaerobacter sp.]
MEMGQFQAAVEVWIGQNGGYWTPAENLGRLMEEIGEIARHVNAQAGRKALPPDAEPVAGEIGDALFVLAALAAQLGTSLPAAADAVLRKQAARGSGTGKPQAKEK